MNSTVFRIHGFRFYFFELESGRMHVHVAGPESSAKIWLEPRVELDTSFNVPERKLREILRIATLRRNELVAAWKRFSRPAPPHPAPGAPAAASPQTS